MTFSATEDVRVLGIKGEPFGLIGDGSVASAVIECSARWDGCRNNGVAYMIYYRYQAPSVHIRVLYGLNDLRKRTVAITSVRPVLDQRVQSVEDIVPRLIRIRPCVPLPLPSSLLVRLRFGRSHILRIAEDRLLRRKTRDESG